MYNAYYPFDLMGHNFLLKCAGVEVTQPVMRFENGRFVIQTSLQKNDFKIDAYCDNDEQELLMVHPQLMDVNQTYLGAEDSNPVYMTFGKIYKN
jgi:hypothetical protein